MADSRAVRSNQSDLHPRLDEVVRRHLSSVWSRPVAAHSKAAFERLAPEVEQSGAPLVLDSGCGTGASAVNLAVRHPDALVIGIDRSAARLARAPDPRPGNVRLVRADLADFWRLAAAAGWRPGHHYLLYPNPWPKAVQLMRRWHAHPVFPALLALGGRLEVRSNWDIYLREFARALALAGTAAAPVVSFEPATYISLFENKYAASGHRLFRLTAQLEANRC